MGYCNRFSESEHTQFYGISKIQEKSYILLLYLFQASGNIFCIISSDSSDLTLGSPSKIILISKKKPDLVN